MIKISSERMPGRRSLRPLFGNTLTQLLAALILSRHAAFAAPPAPNPIDSARNYAQAAIQQQLTSLDKQRQSIRRQLGQPLASRDIPSVDFFNALSPFDQTACPALDRDDLGALIAEAARKHSLAPALLWAVMKQESAFRPCAVSPRGAQGLMQLMPLTSQRLHVADPFDPGQNVQAGAAFLQQLLSRYQGDLRLALAAYNAGPARADQQPDRPFPLETQNYLANILAELGTEPAVQSDIEGGPEAASQTHPSEARTTDKNQAAAAKSQGGNEVPAKIEDP